MTTEAKTVATADRQLTCTEVALNEIQQIADSTNLAALQEVPTVIRTFRIASGVAKMRELITGEILNTLVSLQDTRLGYLTDRAPGNKSGLKPYSPEVVRDCAIEAMIRGAYWVDNEFNIIASGCYLTLNYYRRLVRGLVGGLEIDFGDYQERHVKRGDATITEAMVSVRASWTYRGHAMEVACEKTEVDDGRIPVRVNSAMGTDAIFGKAERKLLAKIHRKVTGSTWLEDQPDGDTIDVQPGPVERLPDNRPAGRIETSPTEQSGGQHAHDTDRTARQSPKLASDTDMQAIWKQVCGIDMLGELDDYEQLLGVSDMHADDVARIKGWIGKQRNKIRNGRGGRANGKGK
jgi:hypothetical protein